MKELKDINMKVSTYSGTISFQSKQQSEILFYQVPVIKKRIYNDRSSISFDIKASFSGKVMTILLPSKHQILTQ